ncbi:hypothetical protein [Cerasicoccus maritimus]|uniref:hypothetical protein n=1 Tax=Cerasicoccus maritimus TaxID=490089 RepID=UPI0028526097|nr:hypothetical protein [Cerasicoccus maritimus]
MAFSQTHSPFAFERERGSISRAAPVIQEAVRIERRKHKTRKIAFTVSGVLLALGASVFIFGKRTNTSALVTPIAPVIAPEQHVQIKAESETNLLGTLATVSDLRTFAQVATVNSVRLSGSSTKATINGKLFRMGEVVAPSLGLKLVGYDSAGKYLVFRDAAGRQVVLPISQRQAS